MTADASRRRPPRERFAPDQDQFDLDQLAEQLRAEPNAGQHGHRQMALFRHGPSTIALYCFDPGSRLPNHVVNGPVVIHVLKGRLVVHTPQGQHELSGGTLLRLAPNVQHDVEAPEASEMLLTVCVEGPGSHVEE